MSVDIESLLARTPHLRNGRPLIAGTGITVHRIATWYKLGHTPEEIARRYGHLTIAQVYAALAYYHANRAEIEADLASDGNEAEKFENENVDRFQSA